MKICPKCGAVNEDDYKFCESCAHEFSTKETSEVPSRLKGRVGGTQYRADSRRTHTTAHSSSTTTNVSSNLKGRVGETKYVPSNNDTPQNRTTTLNQNKIPSSFKGRMGKTEYHRTADSPEINRKQNNSYKFDGPAPVKSPPKLNRTWMAGAFAAIVVMAIAIPAVIHINQRSKDLPIAIEGPNTSVLTYQQFGAELSTLTDQYGIPSEQDRYSSCRLLVSCDDSVDISSLGATKILQSPDGVYVLQYENKNDAIEANKKLSSMRGVEYAEPDILISTDKTGAAGANPISWGTTSIGADVFANQLSSKNHTRVTVAIVDSGVSEHEFLRGRLLNGWDFIGNDADPTDEKSHGTHVAGIVVDATQGLDIALLPVRVLNEQGKGPSSVVGNGIRYAADCGVDIINLSLGGGHSSYIDDAVSYALAKGVIVVVSAGNDSTQTEGQCPAHIDGCITVSAVDQNLSLAGFSNYGGAVDFCAPGVSIYSSVLNNRYEYFDGTSMSTPYITALAAMLKASGMATTVYEVETILADCSLDLGAPGKDSEYGHGLPQVDKLLVEPEAPHTEEPTEPLPIQEELGDAYFAYSKMIYDGVSIPCGNGKYVMATHYELLYMDNDAVPEIILYATDMDLHCFEIYTYSGNSPEMIADSSETCDFSQWFNAGFDLCIQGNQQQSVFYRSSKSVNGGSGSAGVLEYNGRNVSNTSVSLDEHLHHYSEQATCKVLMQNSIVGGIEIGSEDDFLKDLWREGSLVPTEDSAHSLIGRWDCMVDSDYFSLQYTIEMNGDGSTAVFIGEPNSEMVWYCSGTWSVDAQHGNTYSIYFDIQGGDPWAGENDNYSAYLDATVTDGEMILQYISGDDISFAVNTPYTKE